MNFENEDTFEEMNERLDKLIEDRVAAERERCAKIAEKYHGPDSKHAIVLANLIRSGK